MAFDERLRLGVAVAAAAMPDPELGELLPEATGGERGAVVGAEGELARLDRVRGRGSFDEGDRFVGAAAQLQLPGDDLAGAAVDDGHQVRPAVLADPDRRQVELPQLPRPLDPEETGPLPALERPAALDQLPLPHHPEHPLAVDRYAQPAADERGHHPVTVGLVGERLLDDRPLDRIRRRPALRRPPRPRRPVDRLPRDPQHARHGRDGKACRDQLARPGDALAHSQPRNASPAISSS